LTPSPAWLGLVFGDAVFGEQFPQFLPRMPRWPVSILLLFERSQSRTRATSSSV